MISEVIDRTTPKTQALDAFVKSDSCTPNGESTSIHFGDYTEALKLFQTNPFANIATTVSKPRKISLVINDWVLVSEPSLNQRLWNYQPMLQDGSQKFESIQHTNFSIGDDVAPHIQNLRWIKDTLGIGISGLAELFGVTRKTVYDWLSTSHPKRAGHELKIKILQSVLAEFDLEKLFALKNFWDLSIENKPSFLSLTRSEIGHSETFRKNLCDVLTTLDPKLGEQKIRSQQSPKRNYGEAHVEDVIRSL